MPEIRVRFAPSPTGYLHIGHARTALYNWLYARKHNGVFLLRVEDTDQERSTEESIHYILEGLKWLGIDWDEGPDFQSSHILEHQETARRLIEQGAAYKCFCTKEELDRKRDEAMANKITYRYDGACRRLTAEEVAAREAQGLPHVVRFKVPETGASVYEDQVYGTVTTPCHEIEDFIILRTDGWPLYIFSNACDDIRDRITHVIRGADHRKNTSRQALIYDALKIDKPLFAHANLTLDPKRAKISKRKHGEVVTVSFYREKGFLPWALLNFLLLLGWSPEGESEFFTREEAVAAFDPSRLSRTNSVFDYREGDPKFFTDPKAINMNAHYLRVMNLDDLCPLVAERLAAEGLWRPEYDAGRKEWFRSTVDLIRARFHTLADFAGPGRCYFADDFEMTEAAVGKNLKKDPRLAEWLPALADRLAGLTEFTLETTEQVFRDFSEETGAKAGIFINAARASVTGQTAGPGLFEILVTVGRDAVADRLRRAAALVAA